jgi:hypothetical protein
MTEFIKHFWLEAVFTGILVLIGVMGKIIINNEALNLDFEAYKPRVILTGTRILEAVSSVEISVDNGATFNSMTLDRIEYDPFETSNDNHIYSTDEEIAGKEVIFKINFNGVYLCEIVRYAILW